MAWQANLTLFYQLQTSYATRLGIFQRSVVFSRYFYFMMATNFMMAAGQLDNNCQRNLLPIYSSNYTCHRNHCQMKLVIHLHKQGKLSKKIVIENWPWNRTSALSICFLVIQVDFLSHCFHFYTACTMLSLVYQKYNRWITVRK